MVNHLIKIIYIKLKNKYVFDDRLIKKTKNYIKEWRRMIINWENLNLVLLILWEF